MSITVYIPTPYRQFTGNQARVKAGESTVAGVLRELEGLSYEEIAGIMNCPFGTVRSRICRAREAVAAKLRPLLDTAPDRRW